MNYNDDPAKIVIIYDDPRSSYIYDDFIIVTGHLACPRRIILRGRQIQPGPFVLSTWAQPNNSGFFIFFFYQTWSTTWAKPNIGAFYFLG